MNGVPGEKYVLRLEQTSKGFFYIDKLETGSDDRKDLIAEMKEFATDAVEMLKELNKPEEIKNE